MDYERFLKDVKYDLLVPPLGLNFRSMTSKQAKKNFEWFMSIKQQRIEYLRMKCAGDLKISPECLDLRAESLIYIWRWFLKTALIEKTPQDEVEEMKVKYAKFGDTWVSHEKFSVATHYIIRDIGIYLGDVFISVNGVIEWNFITKPKNYVHVNKPLLIGFIDNRYTPAFNRDFEPIASVHTQALKIIKETPNETDLYELCKKWITYIPQNTDME